MNLAYTTQFTISDEIIIRKSSATGDGVIPNTITVKEIVIWPSKSGDVYPTWWRKGLHSTAGWVKSETEMPIWNSGPVDDSNSMYLFIKPDSGSVTFNMEIRGEV